MDEAMEDTCTYEYTFTVVEIDLDYEFDAPRYFDFSSEETPAEAHEAQRWFDSARSYPPSPVAKLVPRLDLLLENVNTSPKRKDADDTSMSDSDCAAIVNKGVSVADVKQSYDEENDRVTSINIQTSSIRKSQSQIQEMQTGLSFHNQSPKDNFRKKMESAAKPSFPRGSTLMKPTASQLAKRYKSPETSGSRFLKSLAAKNQKGSANHSVIEVQAAKRQKLEGGHLHKVGETNQQINFVHKEPKKDGTGYISTMQGKLRITIPREPNLETANRAQRTRSKASEEADTAVPRFKARPLNRKILEAPSLFPKKSTKRSVGFQEFYLKTSERATQHALATSTSIVPSINSDKVPHKSCSSSTTECGNKESRRLNLVDTSKQEGLDLPLNFKTFPKNKKIFTSKGDTGVLQNTMGETTVLEEPSIQIGKRSHHYPPVELFNKLSLASDPQTSAGSQLKPPMSICLLGKGSKENRWSYFLQNEINHAGKEKLPWAGETQHQFAGRMNQLGPAVGISSEGVLAFAESQIWETQPLLATGMPFY